MSPGHPMFEHINEIIMQTSNMGFWTNQIEKYMGRRQLRATIQRQLIIFNYLCGLNNSLAVDRYQKLFEEPSAVKKKNQCTFSILLIGGLVKYI